MSNGAKTSAADKYRQHAASHRRRNEQSGQCLQATGPWCRLVGAKFHWTYTPINVAATRQVANSILTHKLGNHMSHANARLSREFQDLKNLVMATAFFGNLDRGVDNSSTTTTTTTSQQRHDDPIQKQPHEEVQDGAARQRNYEP